eukprot:2281197-Rhodomonas_salina.1
MSGTDLRWGAIRLSVSLPFCGTLLLIAWSTPPPPYAPGPSSAGATPLSYASSSSVVVLVLTPCYDTTPVRVAARISDLTREHPRLNPTQ